ncbi:exo-beta-1,3-glucanase [bacterium]|nr:exo-beta-1,3-glucanase [bacterium]
MPIWLHVTACFAMLCTLSTAAAEEPPILSLVDYLTGSPPASMMGYTPSELDPRNPANQARLTTTSLKADLVALRPAFDGLILYGYHEASTPRTLAIAKELGYRAVLLGIWDIKSTSEIDGVAELTKQYRSQMAIGIIVGNEGLTFGRYEEADLAIAAEQLHYRLGNTVPLTTTEPLVGYQRQVIKEFGDFLCPNIHPVFDRPNLNAIDAAAWTRTEAARLASETGKSVLVKETGFPHAGKDLYTPDTQREFWQAYLAPGRLNAVKDVYVFHGVAFEAFDLAWKAEASGLEFERSWGLMSSQRQPYPAFDIWKAAANKP